MRALRCINAIRGQAFRLFPATRAWDGQRASSRLRHHKGMPAMRAAAAVPGRRIRIDPRRTDPTMQKTSHPTTAAGAAAARCASRRTHARAMQRRPRPPTVACVPLLVVLSLAACAGPASDKPPGNEAMPQAEPSRETRRSLYAGWVVFQDNCSGCHGWSATGTERGPNLVARMAGMSPYRFADLVMRRYDRSASGSAARESLLADIVRRERGEAIMPAWQDDPVVSRHIRDLYAYLSARASGTLGSERPRP
jgi:mono/diheme cytochrome c family protein